MKVEMKDLDGNKFSVGYDYFDEESGFPGQKVPLFWIDSPEESITLRLNTKNLLALEESITLLRNHLKDHLL